MKALLTTIDRLLRGEYTRREDLREGRISLGVGRLLLVSLLLGAVYGVFMGLYGVMRPEAAAPAAEWNRTLGFLQMISVTLKVPLLFLFTLVVTYPSLYVFSTLAGSRLRFLETLRLLLAGIVINLTLLASFGPVTGFFTLSTDSYPFMKVLNVIFFTVGGLAGLIFMYKALDAVMEASGSSSGSPAADPAQGASRARGIFIVWTIIYGAVGAQMGWILRPFIGDPNLPFDVFRERESHFFEAFFRALCQLFG